MTTPTGSTDNPSTSTPNPGANIDTKTPTKKIKKKV